MGNRNKLILLIIIGAVIFIVLRVTNSQVNKATSVVNEEVQAQVYSVNREPPVAITEEGLVASPVKTAITIVGAAPVETRLSPSVEQKREAGVFRSGASISSNVIQEELSPAPSSGIDIKKEAASEEHKKTRSKEVVIF